ncbi:MAG: hypothetical protein ACP5G4_05255 [bacterium]
MKKATLLILLIAVPLLQGWEKFEGNPVLGPVMPWAWLALADPSLIALPEGGFYMVYTAAGLDTATGETLTRPGAAWSEDGFAWTMSDWTVISSGLPGTWDSAAVETPALVHDGDSILMYYAGERAHGGGQLAIGLAVSHDGGYTYERVGTAPIITRDTTRWEEYRSIESPTVIRRGDSLLMWFSGQSLEWKVNVCRAASFDGVNWFRHPDNPVLETGEPGEFDEWAVYAPCVRAVGETLIMIYNGFMLGDTTYDFDSTFLGYATSTDKGITWAKSSENPILGPSLIGEWDSTGPKTPTFDIRDGELTGCYWNGNDGRLGIFTHTFMAIEETTPQTARPETFEIYAYPNPFNSAVTIAIDDVGDGSPVPVSVEIYDVNGRRIAQLPEYGTVGEALVASRNAANGDFPETGKREGTSPSPTTREFVWTPDESLPSGIYLVRARYSSRSLSGAETTVSKRVIYLK